MARRDRPPIQRCLRRGDEIIVQIIKEGIGTKGPTLSTYLSIPGRILVMMPGMGKMGVSRKIEDEDERRRLRQILDSLKPPKDVGFIIRTAGIGKTKAEIQRDLKYLTRLWQTDREEAARAARRRWSSTPRATSSRRTVRDVFTTDVDRIIVDNKDVAKRVKEVIKITDAADQEQGRALRGAGPAVPQVRHRARHRADVQPPRAAAQRRVAGHRLDRGDRRHRREQRQVPRPLRRGDDRLQDRHGGRRRDPAAAQACATWAA